VVEGRRALGLDGWNSVDSKVCSRLTGDKEEKEDEEGALKKSMTRRRMPFLFVAFVIAASPPSSSPCPPSSSTASNPRSSGSERPLTRHKTNRSFASCSVALALSLGPVMEEETEDEGPDEAEAEDGVEMEEEGGGKEGEKKR